MKKLSKKLIAITCMFIMLISLAATPVSAARVGDVVGYAQPTDIVATINGYQLESFNVNGYTYICVEDLQYYGFNVVYNNYSRTLTVTRNYSVTTIDPQNTNSNFWNIGKNNKRRSILYTDISTYVNGNYVSSCNLNGQTIICFDELGAFGNVSYDDSTREISLVLPDVTYNPVAVFAANLNDVAEYNSDWKTIWRAKGDVLMLIGTARSYMDAALRNDYIVNRFPSDKSDMYEVYSVAVENGVPVSSVYIEARNSDGTVVASYQTE